ncbi:MAG: 30S ribosomal protein S20 [Steroidobacteraceae bacterium]
MANTKSAEKAARQSTQHRARNDALTSQLRSAIRKATLALKAGKHDEAATALADATPVKGLLLCVPGMALMLEVEVLCGPW